MQVSETTAKVAIRQGNPPERRWCVEWQTPAMPAQASWYYATRREARDAARGLRRGHGPAEGKRPIDTPNGREPFHTHRPADGPIMTCPRCKLDGAAPLLADACRELLADALNLGGRMHDDPTPYKADIGPYHAARIRVALEEAGVAL